MPNQKKKFSYYARIVMLITLSIEFLLSIVFLAVIGDVKNMSILLEIYDIDLYKIFERHYKGISATFSLFFIAFFIFLFLFIIKCSCNNSDFGQFDYLLKELNHFILFICFLICQLLYFIDCMIIPVYLQRIENIKIIDSLNPELKNIKKKYRSLTAVCFIFLFIIVFLDLIILNLYKKICCQMNEICKKTDDCCENFGRCFGDVLNVLSCNKNEEGSIKRLKDERDMKIQIISNLTEDIKDLLAQNIYLELEKKNRK